MSKQITGTVAEEPYLDTITSENFAEYFAGKYAGWIQTDWTIMMIDYLKRNHKYYRF